MCALSETKLKGKGEVLFGEAVGRAAEGVALLLSGRLMRCVVEWKEVSSRLMWVRVKIERERVGSKNIYLLFFDWVFILFLLF